MPPPVEPAKRAADVCSVARFADWGRGTPQSARSKDRAYRSCAAFGSAGERTAKPDLQTIYHGQPLDTLFRGAVLSRTHWHRQRKPSGPPAMRRSRSVILSRVDGEGPPAIGDTRARMRGSFAALRRLRMTANRADADRLRAAA